MKEIKIAVIIINYNSKKLLERCILSINENDENPLIFILDNNSSDKNLEYLKSLTKYDLYIKYLEENIGYTSGCNEAFRIIMKEHGTPQIVLFLNPDTIIPEGGVHYLYNSLITNSADLIYPKSQLANGQPYCSGTFFDMRKMTLDNHYYKNAFNPIVVDFYQGSAFMIKGTVFSQLNGLNDKLFMYYDEADFAFRMKEAKYKIVYDPTLTITHDASYSLRKKHYIKAYYMARNSLFIFLRYSDNIKYSTYLWIFYHHFIIVLLKWYLRSGHLKSIAYALLGYYHFLIRRYGKL